MPPYPQFYSTVSATRGQVALPWLCGPPDASAESQYEPNAASQRAGPTSPLFTQPWSQLPSPSTTRR